MSAETRPDPLVPAEVDLRDFGFMPLDVRTLLTSTLWIKAKKDPRVAHAAVSLWCECWHQVPAASLPNDDEVLADLAKCDPKEWARIKDRALLHFVECSDGRLYHRHVAAKALESWASKQAQRARTAAATAARAGKKRGPDGGDIGHRDDGRNGQRDGPRDAQRHEQRDVERDVHQGTVKGQGREELPPTPKGEGRFPDFWSAWPNTARKTDRKKCLAKWQRHGWDSEAGAIVAHVVAMKATRQWLEGYEPAPLTYLNGERWRDGVSPAVAAAAAFDLDGVH